MTHNESRTALITGASRGLGAALADELARRGWNLILTARGSGDLAEVAGRLGATGLAGDVTDPRHRAALSEAVDAAGGIDLLVNNASTLGAAPLPPLAEYPLDRLPGVFDTNVIAPLALIQATLPGLRSRHGAVINISSDAATGGYEGWGGYGASKAAVDQLSNVLAAEEPDVRVWAVDPSEMRTTMLADAVGESDAAEAPQPGELAVPAILRLIDTRPGSGRYLATEVVAQQGV